MADERRRRMQNVMRYLPLIRATELATRQNELYQAMLIVESCGASMRLTEAITKLGARMTRHQRELEQAIDDSISGDSEEA